jgi:hypothetical protein
LYSCLCTSVFVSVSFSLYFCHRIFFIAFTKIKTLVSCAVSVEMLLMEF